MGTGTIDISLPGETPVTVTMNSTLGVVYTEFDLQLLEKDGLNTFQKLIKPLGSF